MPEVGRFYWGNHNDRTLIFLGEIATIMTFSTSESVRQTQAVRTHWHAPITVTCK
jgi:hypothetical protein